MEFTKKVFRSGKRLCSYIITIPSDVVKAYEIKENDFVTMDLKKVIKK